MNAIETKISAALADAGLPPEAVGYVNLHGTGTQANDAMEMKAVSRIWRDGRAGHLDAPAAGTVCESTKGLTGHCLGAAGAVEAAICLTLIREGLCRTALSNSFAFGGSNASVVFTA